MTKSETRKKKTPAKKSRATGGGSRKAAEAARRRILVVDDQPQVVRHVEEVARDLGFDVEAASSAEEAMEKLREGLRADAMILDRNLGSGNLDGVAAIPRIREVSPHLPIVMLTGEASYRLAVEAVQAGANDFVEKDGDLDEQLEMALGRLGPTWGLVDENSALQAEVDRLRQASDYYREELFKKYQIVGTSPAIREVARVVEEVGPIPRPVLVRGERGTGKELVAAAIHKASPRAGGPFVTINCAAFAEGLLECEMFGQEEGGYTDAQFRKGRFELAHKGTLFLDEVGNMPLPFQQKMLRVLEYQEFSRVGGSATIKVDVRVVAATNADLEAQMEDGSFRRDLYDRLTFETIELPPLRHRKDDLAPLVLHFLSILSLEAPGAIPEGISEAALARLQEHDWPGNVREFKNYVERVAYRSRATRIEVEHLLPFPGGGKPGAACGTTLKDRLRYLEGRLVEEALASCGSEKGRVAEVLGVAPAELEELLRAHALDTKKF